MNIDCKATRSGKWWAVEVPVGNRTFYTQGRDLKEARFMAEDILKMCAEDQDLPTPISLSANICPQIEYAAQVEQYQSQRSEVDKIQKKLKQAQKSLVDTMRAQGIKMVDIAQLLGISKGRVSQISKQ